MIRKTLGEQIDEQPDLDGQMIAVRIDGVDGELDRTMVQEQPNQAAGGGPIEERL